MAFGRFLLLLLERILPALVVLLILLMILARSFTSSCGGGGADRYTEARPFVQHDIFTRALKEFYDKYHALPGDMKNATEVFGKDFINGNGDGMLDANTTEAFQFWRQLAVTGRVGHYSGTSASASAMQWEFGKNAPRSTAFQPLWKRWLNIERFGWVAMSLGDKGTVYAGDDITYAGNYGLVLVLGGLSENGQPGAPSLKPEDAWHIDAKLDDGNPATGSVRARNWRQCTTSTSNTDTSGEYKRASQLPSCALYFVTGY